MKLKNYVKDNPDKLLSIGSGVAFFFIGNAEQFNADIDDINDRYYNGFVQSLHTAEVRLANLKEQGEPTEETVIEYWDNFGHARRRKLTKEQTIKNYYKQIHTLENSIEERARYIENYTHLKEREIIEVYSKDNPDDGWNVLVEGCEEGRYWFKEEYDTGYIEVSVGVEGLAKRKIRVR